MRGLIAGILILALAAPVVAQPGEGYQARVSVAAPARIDWSCVLGPSKDIAVPGYASEKQTYELFVPPRKDKKKALPLILFVSPGAEPAGWRQFEKVCKARGFLFASPRDAGNSTDVKKRVRIVCDVLDDLRRKFPVDPDRTYIGGFSGGGRIACGVGFALPEYFGGVISAGAAGDLRQESWLRHRVIDRLSVAFLTGESDFNRGEVERFRGPMLRDVGVRVKWWVQPKLGHAIPGDKLLGEAVTWLEEAAKQRAALAKEQPTTRLTANQSPARAERAKAVLAEGKTRAGKRSSVYRGLMQVKGVMQRYPELPVGREAEKFLTEFSEKGEKGWEVEDVAEQRRFLIARAKSLDAYATGALPPQYAKMRPDMLEAALRLYQIILKDRPDGAAAAEARKRIAALEKMLKKE